MKNKKKFIIISFFIIIILSSIIFLIISFIKRENYNFTIKFDNIKGTYISNVSDNIYHFIVNEDLKNVDTSIDNIMINNTNLFNDNITNFNYYLPANKNLKSDLQKLFNEDTKNNNKNIEKIKYKNKDNSYVFYSYYFNNFKFKYSFDKDSDYKYWGINKNSNDLLYTLVKINYYINENDYSVSVFDENNNELIFIKDKEIKSKTYNNIWESFIKKCNDFIDTKTPVTGSDEFIFPNINVKELSLVKEIKSQKIENKVIQKYYIDLEFIINGSGKALNIDTIDLNIINIIDKVDDIKYNFIYDSILFIRDKNKQKPYFALKY